MSKEDKVILSIRDTELGLEVKINEGAYGNYAIVGLLEKIKLDILDGNMPADTEQPVNFNKSYDA
jgi:hypothetical protein